MGFVSEKRALADKAPADAGKWSPDYGCMHELPPWFNSRRPLLSEILLYQPRDILFPAIAIIVQIESTRLCDVEDIILPQNDE